MNPTHYPFMVNPDIHALPCTELVVRCDFALGLSPADAEALRSIVMDWAWHVQRGDFGTVPAPKHGSPANLWHIEVYQAGPLTMECEMYGVMCTQDAIPAILARLSRISSITSVEIE